MCAILSHHSLTRMFSSDVYSTDGLLRVGREEGVSGLWSGACSSLILTINPAIQFMAYEAMKRQMQSMYKSKELNSLVVFGVGAAAKALATVLTYPIQLVQAKQRVWGRS